MADPRLARSPGFGSCLTAKGKPMLYAKRTALEVAGRKPAVSIRRNASSTSSPSTFGTTTIASDESAGVDRASLAGQGGGDQPMGWLSPIHLQPARSGRTQPVPPDASPAVSRAVLPSRSTTLV